MVSPISTPGRSTPLSPLSIPGKDLPEASIKLAGVPLPQQHFEWRFTPGANPFMTSFRFNLPEDSILKGAENPTSIEIRAFGRVGGAPNNVNLSIQNVHLMERRKPDAFHVLWEVADARFLWRGEKITLRNNITWKTNFLGNAVQTNSDNPALLRVQFDRFQKFRYLPWSVKKDGKPYTALEVLVLALAQLPSGKVTKIPPDNGYILENIIYLEEPAAVVLTSLAAQARVDIGIGLDGKPYLYSIDELDLSGGLASVVPVSRPPVDGGVIYKQDLHRMRPPRARIKFAKRQEVYIFGIDDAEYSTDTDNRIPIPAARLAQVGLTEKDAIEGRAVAARNVIQLPHDVTDPNTGQTRQRLTWMPFSEWITSTEVGLTHAKIRSSWFNGILEISHAIVQVIQQKGFASISQPDLLALQRVAAVKQHYRQTWKIDPFWVWRWESWSNNRVSVVDPVTRFSNRSPLYADYCIVPKIRIPQWAKTQRLWKETAYNVLPDVDDPNRDQPYSAGTVDVVDDQLGIFKVSYPPDTYQIISEIIPSGLDPVPVVSPAAASHLWQDTKLRNDFTLETIISVTPSVNFATDDADEGQFFEVVVPNTDAKNSRGPEIEFLSRVEVSRHPVTVGLTSKSLGLGETNIADAKAAIAQGIPVNVGVITATALSEATRIFHSYRDRSAGFAVFPGLDISKLKLFGQCKNIAIQFNAQFGMRTAYDISTPPTIPDLIHPLSEDVRRYLYKQLPQQ